MVETDISCAAAVKAGSAIPQMEAATAGFGQTKAERGLYLSGAGIVLTRGTAQSEPVSLQRILPWALN